MPVNHRGPGRPTLLEGGISRCCTRVLETCPPLPALPTHNARTGSASEILIKRACGAAKTEGALGVQPSRVQREPFTDKEIWGSVKAGQSPNCPQSWPRDLSPSPS